MHLKNTIYNDKLFKDKTLADSLKKAANIVSKISEDLNKDFFKATNIESQLIPPQDIQEMYRTLEIVTGIEQGSIGLFERGDGIKVRYIPSILNFISKNTSNICIWGYEEPENSLEYNLAMKMAEDFYQYSDNNQIFLTTHSPAFIQLGETDRYLYRCYKKDGSTSIINIEGAEKIEELSSELGYMHLLNKQFKIYENKIYEFEKLKKESEILKEQLLQYQKPILMTEGKTDVTILKEAWKRLYKYECPFEIKSCDVFSAEAKSSAAGCDMLEQTLKSWKYDAPNLLIGLFDNDAEGIKHYFLDQNFKKNNEKDWQKHKNGKAYAILLPLVENKEMFAQMQNLCIEFYFDREDLNKKIDGKGLEFEAGELIEKFGNIITNKRQPDIEKELYLFKPKASRKAWFAEKVVPSFSDNSFSCFEKLFNKVLDIIDDYNQNISMLECAITEHNKQE